MNKKVNAIVGYTGFVGSNLLQYYNFDYFYNSKNFHEAFNKNFDTIFFCGVPAVKWYANKNPEEDSETINQITKILDTVNAKKFVLISTIDVYHDVESELNEDNLIDHTINHTYGKNRFLFEEYIKNRYSNYNIIRLPGLFGKGLKKNIIYDLIHNNNVEKIPFNSSFQWYFLDWLKKDIDIVLKNDIKICNFFTDPLDTKRIFEIFQNIFNKQYDILKDESMGKKYNSCSKYGLLFGGNEKYIRNKDEIVAGLVDFFNFEKLDKSKLCVSNICVNNTSQNQFSSVLKLYGIKNIQVAPTKLISNWEELPNIDFSVYKNFGLNVYSFQSITYTLNNLNIFDINTQNDLYRHLTKVVDCAERNDVKILVFGCPRNRKVLDETIDNNQTFIDFFKRIGNYLDDKNVKICLENNSKEYNCNFINTIEECSYLVREIDRKNIKMMVDLGNSVMENDSWYYLKTHMDIIYNIDVAHEYMKDFSEVHESNEIFNFVMKNNEYDNMINLEMLIKDGNNELEILRKSLNNFINIYGF
jgi:nucleoside-diphosphate-sugar epimerase